MEDGVVDSHSDREYKELLFRLLLLLLLLLWLLEDDADRSGGK